MSHSADASCSAINLAFGRTLRRHRLAQSMTQEALARSASISVNGVYMLEYGRRSPKLDTIDALCTSLGVALSNFLAEVESERIKMRGGTRIGPI
ncbi:helix-turn-helix domain-containing protein [Pandoraea iniqua]|uniref:helix-turn-helix domain-containing protein n=1 Tax=Pandoraea iniqua TaxID=2508288 RepID=UPI00124025CE